MDDKTIFTNQQTSTTPGGEPGGRLTVNDLYGPSTTQPTPPQAASESVQPETFQQTNTEQQISVQDIPQQGTASPGGIPQEAQPIYSQTDTPPQSSPFSALRNKKVILIGGAIGLLLVLIVVIGIISRLFRPGNGGAYSKATITYWGLWEEKKTLQLIIDDFEKKYPGIKINYDKQDPQKYKERLLTRIKNNTEAPDIFIFHNTWVPTLTNSSDNILVPLSTDIITPEEFKKNYFSVVQRDMTKNGAIYGLPQGMDTLALFINKDIFDAASAKVPQTWEEFNSVAKALTVKEANETIKTSGGALGLYDNVTHASDIISLLMVTNGIDINTIDKQRDFVKEAISYYVSFASGSNKIWDKTMRESRDAFAGGSVAMYFGYSWDIFIIKAANKDLKFTVHPVPYLPREGSTSRLAIASYWANGVSQSSKHQRESLLFLKYLSEKDVLQKIYTESSKTRLFGMPYARKDLARTLSDNPLVYPFVEQADYATSSYFSSDTKDSLYNEPLNDYLGNAIRQVHASVSLDTAVETFIQGIAQVRSNSSQ